MKRILRSVIDFQDDSNTPDLLLSNFQRLKDSKLTWARPDDAKIHKFIQDYVEVHLGDVPTIHTVQDYFERSGDTEAIERLSDLAKTPCYTRSNFAHLLKDLVTTQNEVLFQHILKSAQEIGTKGLTVGEGKKQTRLQGIRDALAYISDQTMEILPNETNAEIRGDAREDTGKAWLEYQDAKANQGAIGKIMGIDSIDQVCRGCKPGELWIHAGFPGELKCLPGDTIVYDYETSRNWTLQELHAAKHLPTLAGFSGVTTEDGPTLAVAKTKHLWSNGYRAVYDLLLADGSRIGATDNHMFLTRLSDCPRLGEWISLRNLTIQDEVAVAPTLPSHPGQLAQAGWSAVRGIVYRGIEEVFDLEVPVTHSLVANGIVTHNTTLALNWGYNLVSKYRTNIMFASLEMKMNQLRRSVYTLHSANPKFKKSGLVPANFRGLDYRKIRDGELSPEDEVLYQEMLKDFNEDQDHCRFKIWCPAEDVTIQRIKQEAEQAHREMELGFLAIDHSLLVKGDSNSKEYAAQMNQVVRDAKKLALHFNNGQGLPVLLLQQINRQGKLAAEKNNGEYNASALAQVNEAEKSADYITTTYLSKELREQGRTVVTNIKNRDNPIFDTCELGVDFVSRKIYDLSMAERASKAGVGMDEPDEELLNATMMV
jgi:replicative DNA helicase